MELFSSPLTLRQNYMFPQDSFSKCLCAISPTILHHYGSNIFVKSSCCYYCLFNLAVSSESSR